MSGFRAAWRADWRLRAADLAAHAAAAWLLPGPWFYQWLPDMALPVLWLRGMWRDRWEPADSLLLQWHRLLHLRPAWLWAVSVAVPAMAAPDLAAVMALHVLVHVGIDSVTHGEGWS